MTPVRPGHKFSAVHPALTEGLAQELAALRTSHQLRVTHLHDGPSRTDVVVDGHPALSFSSNDYLGLANHPALAEAAAAATARTGFGSGASRLISGEFPEHRALERALADFFERPSALMFPTGYQTNIGVISSLATPDDLILSDAANHASLIDGCRLSRATVRVYPHLDFAAVAAAFQQAEFRPYRRRFLVTESVFSMDGDIAPIARLAELAQQYGAALIVDEAHAVGALGPGGRGICAHAQVQPDVLIGTLGKAFGAFGGFVVGSSDLRATLVNRARTFLFTTAPPPAVAAAALAALHIIRSAEGDRLRLRLSTTMTTVADLLGRSRLGAGHATPIFPIILGQNHQALAASAHFQERSIFVQAIRPPTVPEGTARLRLTVSAAHTPADLERLKTALPCVAHALPAANTIAVTNPPIHPRGIFIAGTDTNVGKTTVSCALLHLAQRTGRSLLPFKPAESGVSASAPDSERLQQAARLTHLPIELIAPFRFGPATAPAVAAALEGTRVTLSAILQARDRLNKQNLPLLVESAGGLLSPYAPDLTSADVAAGLRLPILLIARNTLGAINHTALTVSEIRRRKLPFLGTLLVDTAPPDAQPALGNADLIEAVTGLRPLGTFPFLSTRNLDAHADALAACMDTNRLWDACGGARL